MTKFARECAKAIGSFIGVFVSVVLARLSSGESPLPALDDLPGWLALLGGCFGTALLVWWRRNALTPSQIATGYTALPDHEQAQVVAAIRTGPGA